MWFYLCFALLTLSKDVYGYIGDEMAETIQLCCNEGTALARNQSSQDCTGSHPLPPGLSPVFDSLCVIARTQCCKEYFQKKGDCETGIEVATSTNRCFAAKDSAKTCCNECIKGVNVGSTKGVDDCKSRYHGSVAEQLLSEDAYVQCCEKSAHENYKNATVNTNSVTMSRKPEVIASLCEDYAPNELCAHHCIPVPGSYRCECNPGFMLMADKRNCIEVEKNRCKPKNPCQHKCIDNGVKVMCSCRRGYELMADGKSCQDIDECQLKLPVCLSGTQCYNIQGSYKCIPVKKTNMDKGKCPPGFVRNIANNVCDDINECKLPHPPCPSYLCENTIGGYMCGGVAGDPGNLASTPTPHMEDRCPTGFKLGTSLECEDVDECVIHKDDCNKLSQFCINTHGSFHCQDMVSKHCPPGFKIDPLTGRCEDINECEDDGDRCRPGQICVNQLGQYDCKKKEDKMLKPKQLCPDGMRMTNGVCEDIDECAEGTHLCDTYQSCLNTNGSFECHCNPGYELDVVTGACADVNECATGQHDCVSGSQRCDNTVGSFLCIRITSCGTGYILHHSTGKCEDIDECALGTHNCVRAGPEYQCFNIPGSFRCKRLRPSTTSTTPAPEYEYEYYDSEEEIPEGNETVSNAKPQESTSTTTTTTTARPIEIPTTKSTTEIPTTKSTTEIPTTNSTTEAPATTSSTPKIIFETTPEIERITDVEKEIEKTTTAKPEIEKEKEEGPELSTSEPEPKFTYIDPKQSESNPISESTTQPDKGPKYDYSPPEVTPYTPPAPKPSEGPVPPLPTEPTTPVYEPPKPEEPEISNTIDPIPLPENPETTYRTPESSSKYHGVYVNVGNHTAVIPGERRDDGSVVIDTNSVPKNQWTRVNARPVDCPRGFEVDEYGACFDIDECAINNHSCSGLTEACRNTMGGYVCDCAPGFRRDLMTGACDVLITSSTSSTTSTTTSTLPPTTSSEKTKSFFWGYPEYRPTSRPFRPRNLCDTGFHLNSKTGRCEDINECTNGQASCASVEICVNTEGGYRCECPPNWRLDEVRHRCMPIRNKEQFPPGFGNVPANRPVNSTVVTPVKSPKFIPPAVTHVDQGAVFKCPWGYKLGDDNTCQDIDECATGEARCGPIQICTNQPGGYTCSCPPGHKLVGDHECEDVDECVVAGKMPICSQNADCVNTVGSYQCKCHTGFRSAPVNDKVCVDVDECTENRAGTLCQQRCNNVWGSYRCSCHRGYRLNLDNSTCSDIDECVEFKSSIPCVGRCINEPGSYRCSCPAGYRLSEDKRSCIDIDECETGEASCAKSGVFGGTSHVCFNTRGSYRCQRISCPPGYRLESKHRCKKIETICKPGDWECAHQPTTISYNFITFVSKLYIPDSKVNLFTMRGPAWPYARMKFMLRLIDVDAPPTVKEKADINAFLLLQKNNEAAMSLVRPLEGPQSIELEMSMELYNRDQFGGTAMAKIFIFVSEYEF